VGGQLVDKWSATGINPGGSLAAGNIDGKPGNEVVACGDGGITRAFRGDGTVLWSASSQCYMPSIADIDGDGAVEIIVEGGILNGATGALKHAFTPVLDTRFVVSDVDADGTLDVVTADRIYHADGTLCVDTKLGGNWPGVADFDHDGVPEVVLVDTTAHAVTLWQYDKTAAAGFKVVRSAVDINLQFATNHCPSGAYGFLHGGGPPIVADFNGDGTPDVGVSGGIGYVTLDGAKLLDPTQAAANTILWSKVSTDCSSGQTGSVAFDFDGDGKSEVLYSDEEYLRHAGVRGRRRRPPVASGVEPVPDRQRRVGGRFGEVPVASRCILAPCVRDTRRLCSRSPRLRRATSHVPARRRPCTTRASPNAR
jgi:hypothetical protein